MKKKKIEDPILGFHWHLQFGGCENKAIKQFCKLYDFPFPEGELDLAGGFTTNIKYPYVGLIWVRQDRYAATIAHECAHATVHVCRVLDMDPREANEFQASYTGYLVNEFFKMMEPKRKKK